MAQQTSSQFDQAAHNLKYKNVVTQEKYDE